MAEQNIRPCGTRGSRAEASGTGLCQCCLVYRAVLARMHWQVLVMWETHSDFLVFEAMALMDVRLVESDVFLTAHAKSIETQRFCYHCSSTTVWGRGWFHLVPLLAAAKGRRHACLSLLLAATEGL